MNMPYNQSERSDARGLGNTVPNAPPGPSRSDWGLMVQCTQCEATQGVWGIRSPMPHRGRHEVTGGYKEYCALAHLCVIFCRLPFSKYLCQDLWPQDRKTYSSG